MQIIVCYQNKIVYRYRVYEFCQDFAHRQNPSNESLILEVSSGTINNIAQLHIRYGLMHFKVPVHVACHCRLSLSSVACHCRVSVGIVDCRLPLSVSVCIVECRLSLSIVACHCRVSVGIVECRLELSSVACHCRLSVDIVQCRLSLWSVVWHYQVSYDILAFSSAVLSLSSVAFRCNFAMYFTKLL